MMANGRAHCAACVAEARATARNKRYGRKRKGSWQLGWRKKHGSWREAGTARGQGGPAGSQSKDQEQKAKWIRRRLCGKQKALGVTAFAKTAMAKLAAARAEAAAQQAKGKAQENTAEEEQAKSIGLAQIASQAKTEAQQARARARAADKQATENKAIAEQATEYAERLPPGLLIQ